MTRKQYTLMLLQEIQSLKAELDRIHLFETKKNIEPLPFLSKMDLAPNMMDTSQQ
ncbi:MAG: hypothetical protein HQM11_06520 [SAR324 cluster bacterium]|nr:hypothetical protein [SAR324 cluster bacterium]